MSGKYDYLNNLSDERLEELLRQTVEEEGQTDSEYIEFILEVMEEREKSKSENNLSDITKAWDDFKRIYNSSDCEDKSLYDFSAPDSRKAPMKKQHKKTTSFAVKRIVLVALVSCLCLLMMAPALGYNIIQAIGSWTKDVFSFSYSQEEALSSSSENSANEPQKFDSFQDALDASNITTINAPIYLPEGFVETEVNVIPHLKSDEIQAFYTSEDLTIQISITQFEDAYSVQYEKDDTSVEEVVISGITHYLFSNNGRSVATWNVNSIEGSITGDISLEEMKEILESMY